MKSIGQAIGTEPFKSFGNHWKACALSILIVVAADDAAAVTPETAKNVVAQVKKLPSPTKTSSYFEHWVYNTSHFTALHCWKAADFSAPPPDYLNTEPTASGSFMLPKEGSTEGLCSSIAAHGIKPSCTHSVLWTIGVERSKEWPLQYLQLPHADSEIKIGGILYCYLEPKRIDKQRYAGAFSAEWSSRPQKQILQTTAGPREALVGMIMVQEPFAKALDGNAYREPRIVIVQDEAGE